MTQNEMPDEVKLIDIKGEGISEIAQDYETDCPDVKYAKYHHDRVVTTLEQKNARLVEVLVWYSWEDNGDKAKQALAENKE